MSKEDKLQFLQIFCPRFGRKEGTEHEKILFFWPPDYNLGKQQNIMGLSFAFINFAQTFTKDKCQVVHSDQQSMVLYEAEKDFWFVGGYKKRLPESVDKKRRAEQKSFELESPDLSEYIEDSKRDEAMQIFLRQLHMFFQFNFGSFESIIAKGDGNPKRLRKLLDGCIMPLLHPQWLLSKFDMDCMHNAVQLCAHDRSIFLQIHLLVTLALGAVSSLDRAVLFYKDYVIWSNIAQDDLLTCSIYNSFALSPEALEISALCARANRDKSASEEAFPSPYIRFADRFSDQNTVDITDDFLETAKPCHLPCGDFLVYIVAQGDLRLFFFQKTVEDIINLAGAAREEEAADEEDEGEEEKRLSTEAQLEKVKSFFHSPEEVREGLLIALMPSIQKLEALLVGEIQTMSSKLDKLRFVYYNAASFAIRKALLTSSKHSKSSKHGTQVPRDVMLSMAEIHRDLTSGGGGVLPYADGPLPVNDDEEKVTEVTVKTAQDGWIVGKIGQGREIIVVIDNKGANLVETQKEFRDVATKVFKLRP